MTDQSSGRRDAATTAPEAVRPTPTDPSRQLPEEAEAAHGIPDYEDLELARAEIEATRARMSGTIEEIEEVLEHKKERLQDRLDVLAPVKEKPWPSMGVALGSGLLFGLLTGGRDEGRAKAGVDWERRAEILDRRTRRLLAIAREQQEELDGLRRKRARRERRKRLGRGVRHRLEGYQENLAETAGAAAENFEDVREAVFDRLSSFLADSLRRFGGRR